MLNRCGCNRQITATVDSLKADFELQWYNPNRDVTEGKDMPQHTIAGYDKEELCAI